MRYLKVFEDYRNDYSNHDYGVSYNTFIRNFFNYLYELMELKPELIPAINKFRKKINWHMIYPDTLVPKDISFIKKNDMFDYLEKLVLENIL
jgi:hypothetical protein